MPDTQLCLGTQLVPAASGGYWLPPRGARCPPATMDRRLQGEHEAGRQPPALGAGVSLRENQKEGVWFGPGVIGGEPAGSGGEGLCSPEFLAGPRVSWEERAGSELASPKGRGEGSGECGTPLAALAGQRRRSKLKAKPRTKGEKERGRQSHGRREGGTGVLSTRVLARGRCLSPPWPPAVGRDSGRHCFSWTQRRRFPNPGFFWRVPEQLMPAGDIKCLEAREGGVVSGSPPGSLVDTGPPQRPPGASPLSTEPWRPAGPFRRWWGFHTPG